MGRSAPEGPSAPASGAGKVAYPPPAVRPSGRAPTWLVLAVAALAVLGLAEEYVSGPTITGAAATIAFVGMHASWPLVLRWPLWGAALAVLSAVGAVVTLDRVGLATMTAMIALVVTCALARLPVALATLAAFGGWAIWTTIYFAETQAFFWGVALLILLSAAVGAFIRIVVLNLLSTRRRVRQMEEYAERVRREERLAIARELHDVVAHELTLMSLQSASCRRTEDPEVMRAALAQINENSRGALTELRVLLGVLRSEGEPSMQAGSAPMIGADLPEALESLIERVRAEGFDVVSDLQVEGWRELPSTSREATVRIVQEALVNVTKHAPPGTSCTVNVGIHRDRLEISVASALPGGTPRNVDPALSSRQGLIGIQERAQVLGGSAEAGAQGSTWTVRAQLPVDQRGDHDHLAAQPPMT